MPVFQNKSMTEQIVVTGTLVKSSLERVGQWSKSLFFLQLVLFIYRMWTDYDSSQLFVFICTFVLFGIWLPLCGYSSASSRDRTCLTLFAGVQGFLSVGWLVHVWETTRYQTLLKDGCEHCISIFEHGSETCQYGIGHNNDWINIERSECHHIPSTAEIACSAFLMTSISCAGCCAALSARRMLNDNHVVAQLMELVPEVEVVPEVVRVGPDDNVEPYSSNDPPMLVAGRVEEKSTEAVGGVLV